MYARDNDLRRLARQRLENDRPRPRPDRRYQRPQQKLKPPRLLRPR